jgi:hypothetical protein
VIDYYRFQSQDSNISFNGEYVSFIKHENQCRINAVKVVSPNQAKAYNSIPLFVFAVNHGRIDPNLSVII